MKNQINNCHTSWRNNSWGNNMDVTTIILFAAVFHAVAAAMQQIFRKTVLAVAGSRQVGAGIFGTAAVILFLVHISITGNYWYPDIPKEFWGWMAIFVIANTVAAFITLEVLRSETLIGAITILSLAAILMTLVDKVVFQAVLTKMQLLGIVMMVVVGGVTTSKVGLWASFKKIKIKGVGVRSLVAMFLYNMVTPATNKMCATMTQASFSAYIAHVGIAIFFGLAFYLEIRKNPDKKKITMSTNIPCLEKVSPNIRIWLFLASMGVLTAMSNGLLAYAFQLGGSIPAALIMKRALPPLFVLLFLVYIKKKKITRKEKALILAASIGAGITAV